MALNREERKLLHQKATQPTFGNNKPDDKQGNDGDVSYRRVEGSGLVQFVKKNGKWNAVGSTGSKPETRVIGLSSSVSSSGGVSNHGSLSGLSADNHKQYLLVSGSRAMGGNLNMGTNDIGSVGALDVDGHTTLDQVTINTTDGAFAVSGGNDIQLTTAQDLDFNVTGTCDWNTSVTDWDNSSTFDLTSVGNVTIETSGASTDKTILIKNTNNNASGFNGIHLKTDSQNTDNTYNNILIECDNVKAKGSTFGLDLRSENNIRIRAEDNNTQSNSSALLIRATGPIDIGVGSSISQHTSNNRVKLHGTSEIETLFRPASSGTKHSDTHYPINTSSNNVKFDQIDTFKLIRATTFLASRDSLSAGSFITIVDGNNDDNQKATVWRVTVFWEGNSLANTRNFQVWHCYAEGASTADLFVLKDAEVLSSGYGGTLTWTEGSGGGLKWTNNHASVAVDVKASALRIQSGDDF